MGRHGRAWVYAPLAPDLALLPRPIVAPAVRWSLLLILALAACTDAQRPAPEPLAPEAPGASEGAAPDLETSAFGQTVYVPAYSHVYSGDRQRPVDLTATLSVRNADAGGSIQIRRVRYVGTDGRVLRSYLAEPRTLGPLATAEFVVDESDRAGGVGASFLVEWGADAAVAAPVVEAVMISTAGQQGISFVTEGRVVEEVGG